MSWVKISTNGSWLLHHVIASQHVQGKILDNSHDWLSHKLQHNSISNYLFVLLDDIMYYVHCRALDKSELTLPENISVKNEHSSLNPGR